MPKDKPHKALITCSIPADLLTRIDQAAKEQARSRSNFIGLLLEIGMGQIRQDQTGQGER